LVFIDVMGSRMIHHCHPYLDRGEPWLWCGAISILGWV
jgi:hypothetical protein